MAGMSPGDTGTSTSSPTATTVTDTGKAWTTNAFVGCIVTMAGVFGIVMSNTATVLTLDRWSTPATPGGAAASTPSTGVYQILMGNSAYAFMALTANNTAPSATDTTLASEIVTSGGGLIRKITSVAHTTGVASYTLAATFTANGSDSLPVIIAKLGIFNTVVGAAGRMLFETLISPTATLSASGDAVTVSDVVTN